MTKMIDKTLAISDFKKIERDFVYCYSKADRVAGMSTKRFSSAMDTASVEDLYDMIHKVDLTIDALKDIRGVLKPIAMLRLENEKDDNTTVIGSLSDERCEVLSTGNSQGS